MTAAMCRLQAHCIMLFSKGWTDAHGWILKKARSQANSFPVVVGCVCLTAHFHPHCLLQCGSVAHTYGIYECVCVCVSVKIVCVEGGRKEMAKKARGGSQRKQRRQKKV